MLSTRFLKHPFSSLSRGLAIRYQSTKPYNNVTKKGRVIEKKLNDVDNKNMKKTSPASSGKEGDVNKFNAMSNKNLLINNNTTGINNNDKDGSLKRVKKDYKTTLPRVESSTYLAPLHLKLDSLYAMHRPLMMDEFKDELLPSNHSLEESRVEFPSSFNLKKSQVEEAGDLEHLEGKPIVMRKTFYIEDQEALSQFLTQIDEIRDARNDRKLIMDEYEYTDEEKRLGSEREEQYDDFEQRGWQRTPFGISAAGMQEFREWEGTSVGKALRAMNNKIKPFQKPVSTEVKIWKDAPLPTLNKDSELRLNNTKDFYKVETLKSNPPQKQHIKKTRGRVKPTPVIFKKKTDEEK